MKIITDIEKELSCFTFLTPPEMSDGEIKLVLNTTLPANQAKLLVPGYYFDIFKINGNNYVGYFEFRVALTDKLMKYGGHIGYGIEPEYRGNKYSMRSINLAKPFIKLHGINEVLVTCDPNNIPSVKTIENVGGILMDILKHVEIEPNKFRDTCRYIIKI